MTNSKLYLSPRKCPDARILHHFVVSFRGPRRPPDPLLRSLHFLSILKKNPSIQNLNETTVYTLIIRRNNVYVDKYKHTSEHQNTVQVFNILYIVPLFLPLLLKMISNCYHSELFIFQNWCQKEFTWKQNQAYNITDKRTCCQSLYLILN